MPIRTRDPERLAARLAAGDVALMRTDTLPGLHARADRPEAVARIQAIKGRADDKPLLVLSDSLHTALELTAPVPAVVRDYIGLCWPGPRTLILPAGPTAPDAATRGGATVAIRVPALAALRDLLAAAGGALVSTSVNRAGDEPLTDLEAAVALCGEAVDVVGEMTWDESLPDRPAGASTLLDLTTWPPTVIRAGDEAPPPW